MPPVKSRHSVTVELRLVDGKVPVVPDLDRVTSEVLGLVDDCVSQLSTIPAVETVMLSNLRIPSVTITPMTSADQEVIAAKGKIKDGIQQSIEHIQTLMSAYSTLWTDFQQFFTTHGSQAWMSFTRTLLSHTCVNCCGCPKTTSCVE